MKKLLTQLRDTKFRTKLSAALLLVGIVPLLLLSLTLYLQLEDVIRNEETASMNTSLQQAGATVENQVKQDGLLCRYVIFSDSLQKVLASQDEGLYERYQLYTESVNQMLNTARYLQKGAQNITVYSETIPVSYGHTLQPLQEMQQRDWYYKIQPGGGLQWFMDSSAPNSIDSVCRTSNYLGTEKSYLAVRYSLSSFLQPFQQMKQENTDVAVFSGDRLLYASGGQKDGTVQANFAAKVRAGHTCVQRHIDGLNWDVYLYATGHSMSAAARQTAARTLLMVLSSLALLAVLERFLSLTMTHRIEALTANMVAVSQGDMTLTVYSDAHDEVGVMIATFRNMVQRINNLIHEVYESQLKQKEAEMKALQSQINPHFLYNTLSMINWKALAAGEKDISRITLSLSSFYRTTLNRGRTLTTAADELKNIRAYLDIQLMMHDNSFTVEWQDVPGLDAYTVPKLILQPIVENALEHGLYLKEEGERRLTVRTEETDTELSFVIQDNGVGMTPQKADSIIHCETTGYGMKNVNDRIVLLYGSRYALQIESKPGDGTTVTVRIPKHPEGDEKL